MGAWIETFTYASYTIFFWVAPRVGAWIETPGGPPISIVEFVAPRVGAWIETIYVMNLESDWIGVAPRVGAWIETITPYINSSNCFGSHPAWVRGLKQEGKEEWDWWIESHPAWVRGLKQRAAP